MCIKIGETSQVIKIGELKLWKVIRKDNRIGLWGETHGEDHPHNQDRHHDLFILGVNTPHNYEVKRTYFNSEGSGPKTGRFHCFFTREAARQYLKYRAGRGYYSNPVRKKKYVAKIIVVYADSADVVEIGEDWFTKISAISVSKMTIKSLKHQR